MNYGIVGRKSKSGISNKGMYKLDALTKYFQEIEHTVKFKNWFFGHYHDNRNLASQKILLYEQIIRIA